MAEVIFADRDWLKCPGASEHALEALVQALPIEPPAELLALLRHSNGGEGPLPIQPLNFVLDSAEVITEAHRTGAFREFFPDLLIIGSNGGGEAFALDLRAPPQIPVAYFDMTNCDLAESVVEIAPNFATFLTYVGRN